MTGSWSQTVAVSVVEGTGVLVGVGVGSGVGEAVFVGVFSGVGVASTAPLRLLQAGNPISRIKMIPNWKRENKLLRPLNSLL